MKIPVYSTKAYDRSFLAEANAKAGRELHFLEERLNERSAALEPNVLAAKH